VNLGIGILKYHNSHSPKFIFSHRGALGDFLLTWPTLFILKKHFFKHKFIGLGKTDYLDLAHLFGLVDDIYNCELKSLMDLYAGNKIPTFLQPADIMLFWALPNSSLTQLCQRENCKKVYFHPPFPTEPGIHVIDHHLSVLNQFSITSQSNIIPYFYLKQKFTGRILIHPGSGGCQKNFTPEFYRVIADSVFNGKGTISFILGPNEVTLRQYYQDKYEIIEPNSIVSLARFISGASLFLGNDSGVTHLAAFLGVRTLGLYKSSSPVIWGIRGIKTQIIEAGTEEEAIKKLKLV